MREKVLYFIDSQCFTRIGAMAGVGWDSSVLHTKIARSANRRV